MISHGVSLMLGQNDSVHDSKSLYPLLLINETSWGQQWAQHEQESGPLCVTVTSERLSSGD